jgi:hypothetical protein
MGGKKLTGAGRFRVHPTVRLQAGNQRRGTCWPYSSAVPLFVEGVGSASGCCVGPDELQYFGLLKEFLCAIPQTDPIGAFINRACAFLLL